MSSLVCSYCNQPYFADESHICKYEDSIPMNYDFQIPIQKQGNVQEMSSSFSEFLHPRTIINSDVANVNNDIAGESSLQDESALHADPANMDDGPVSELPSFQSTIINRRPWIVNQEVHLASPNQDNHMPNLRENIPYIYRPSNDNYMHSETQNNLGETNYYRQFIDTSSNIQSAKLFQEHSAMSYQEELGGNISFALQTQNHIETRENTCFGASRDITEIHFVDDLEVEGSTRSRLKKHICPQCGRECNYKSKLKLHLLVHTDEKPLICDICQKGFTQKGSVKKHKLTHTGAKPFECDICGKAFTWKSNLKDHALSHKRNKKA